MQTANTVAEATQEPGFINGLASAFVEANKDFYFSNIADRELLEQRLTMFADCIENLWKIGIQGKITALSRLVACYVQHSTDNPKEQAQTLNAVTGDAGISRLLEHLAAYSETLEVWADFLGVLLEKFDE